MSIYGCCRGKASYFASTFGRCLGHLVKRIMIEAETPGDFRSMFSLRIHEKIAGNNLTVAQAHVLAGEILRSHLGTAPGG